MYRSVKDGEKIIVETNRGIQLNAHSGNYGKGGREAVDAVKETGGFAEHISQRIQQDG